jgi:4-alpha-glucanotransferase
VGALIVTSSASSRKGSTTLSGKLAFGWVLHQHQPVGNFPWIFAQAYDVCYAPMLDALERHPAIRVTLHYSGPLLDWLLVEHPDYIKRIAALVHRSQIEILTSGYYEPILPIIPESDQIGQIMRMNTAIRRHFGTDAIGAWLAERVWEPNLPSVLDRVGVRYTVLDDTHFQMAGLDSRDLYGYYVTEDQGHPLAIFPSLKLMREALPWKTVHTVEQIFRDAARNISDAPRIIVMGDDGEKFGVWPGTYHQMWTNGYIDEFLTMLESNADWLTTVPLGEYMRQNSSLGRIYIPAASYAEMMEWALPVERQHQYANAKNRAVAENREDILSFLRGGTWRNFAAKYPEANNLHKKMLRIHGKIRSAATLLGPYKTQEAMTQLWKGQCSCGYWHGLFGGLYLADIRSAIYQHLVRAESISDGALASREVNITVEDFDCDGQNELLIEGPLMNIYLAPYDGGSLFEWDWKMAPFNVIDTLARRPEAYHQKLLHSRVLIVPELDLKNPLDINDQCWRSENCESTSAHDVVWAKEPGLGEMLHYDSWRRASLREHFFDNSTTPGTFLNQTYTEQGDFAGKRFEHRVEGIGVDALVVDLWRDGTVVTDAGSVSLRLRKVISIANDSPFLHVDYTLYNTSTTPLKTRFGIEGNWGMLGGKGNPYAWYQINGERCSEQGTLDSWGIAENVSEVALINSNIDVCVTLQPGVPAELWRMPVETISNSEAGLERNYQCSCTLLHWAVDIPPGDRWSVSLRLMLGRA